MADFNFGEIYEVLSNGEDPPVYLGSNWMNTSFIANAMRIPYGSAEQYVTFWDNSEPEGAPHPLIPVRFITDLTEIV